MFSISGMFNVLRKYSSGMSARVLALFVFVIRGNFVSIFNSAIEILVFSNISLKLSSQLFHFLFKLSMSYFICSNAKITSCIQNIYEYSSKCLGGEAWPQCH